MVDEPIAHVHEPLPASIAADVFRRRARALVGQSLTGVVGLVSDRGWEPDWALGFSFELSGIAAYTLRDDDWCFAEAPELIRAKPIEAEYAWTDVAPLLGLDGLVGQPLRGASLRWRAAVPEPLAEFVLGFPGTEVILFNGGDELSVRIAQP
ncbi:MAG: hypothetical protein KC492_00135 [Myxococcales bacterium]|nr:hypothetical protein [Myxococcales bacterium]